MRQGVSRDGHHLYPAHPYTSFAKAGEPDLQALYAYLMVQPASPARVPQTALRFPFNLRPLMAAWNALFLSSAPAPAEANRSAAWNRGAELVEGLGHCAACHSPRNALGAEAKGRSHLAGGFADGWDAPALALGSFAPVAWTDEAFYDYLRTGRSFEHGAAAGPMAQVVTSLAPLPDSDIRAMATYLASLSEPAVVAATAADTIAASEAAITRASIAEPRGARVFEGACAACHGAGSAIPSLALNSNVHAMRPNNLIEVVRHGVPAPVGPVAEAMPGFDGVLDAPALAALVRFVRARFAPGQPPWLDVEAAVAARPNAAH